MRENVIQEKLQNWQQLVHSLIHNIIVKLNLSFNHTLVIQ